MALTRAQLLSGNNNNGFTLPGQPQGVIAGPGISISNTGIISVDSSSVTGLVKLNDPFAYNSYVWPGADGTAGEFLQTDGAGNLEWATPQGFAVVTVQPQPAPVPSDVGELWFDCSTGTLNVYQDCVGGTGWFNVAQPGLPVLPGSTSAVPPFTNQGTPGAGTQANPYDCTITTVPSGSSTFIVNTVTVNGLAPFQYVPIVDLNAVTNLGRFSFSNYYANSSGVLTFQVIFKDLPPSGGGISYTAAIRVGYASAYIEAVVNTTLPLTLSGGSIAGTPTSGVAVAFTPPTASGGSGGYTYTYQWFADGAIIPLATSATFTPTTAEVGKTLSVTTTVTDSSGATASTTTTASSQTASSPISNWAATGSMTTIPGGLSGVYTGTGTNITVTGCIESAVYTPPAVPTFNNSAKPITSGQTLAIRWSTSPTCGGAASGTPISGTVTDGIGTNSYNTVVNRIPTPAIGDITSTNVALNGTVSQGIASPILGLNTTAYVTYVGTSTGGTIGASLTAGGPFTTLATSGQGFPVVNGQTLYIQQTAGNTVNTAPGYTAIIRVGDGTNTAGTYDEFTYFAQTVATATFPGLVFDPAGGPNAAPASVSLLGPPVLKGTATATGGWPGASPSPTSLTVTGDIQIEINGGGFVGAGGPYTISTGQSLSVIWDPAAIAGAVDGDVLNGAITDNTYTNSFQLIVDMDPDPFAADPFGNLDPVATGSTNVSPNTVVPTGFNVPIPLDVTAFATDGLGTPEAAVGLGGFLPTPQTVDPGEGIQLRGIAGGTPGTVYGVDVTLGAPAQTTTWTTKTAPASPAVSQPTITTPGANSTGQGTASGITITSSPYSASGGAGTHASSNWELYANSYPLTSTNKISAVATGSGWNSQSSIAASYAVIYGNGLFVAGDNSGGSAFTSPEGATWTTQTIPGGTGPTFGGGYGNGFYLLTNNTNIASSPDGTNWAVRNTGSPNALYDVCFGSGYYVAVGVGGEVRVSTNLTAWATGTTGGGTLNAVTNNGTLFVAVGVSGTIVAINGNPAGAWSSRVSGGTQNLSDIVYGAGLFVAVGANGVIRTSPDSITWTLRTSGTTNNLNGVDFDGSLFTVVGNSGTILTSPDGINWSAQVSGTTNNLNDIAYGGGTWVIVNAAGEVFSSQSPTGVTILSIANCQTEGFLVGDTVISGSGAAAGPATIVSLDNSQVTVAPRSTNWVGNNTQTLKRDPASYTLADSATNDTVNKESWPVAKPPLAPFTTYYVRVQYTSNPTIATSAWSPWRKFTTGDLTLSGNTAIWTTTAPYLAAAITQVGSSYISAAGYPGFITIPFAQITSNSGVAWTGTTANISNGEGANIVKVGTAYVATANNAIWRSTNGTAWNIVNSGWPASTFGSSSSMAVSGNEVMVGVPLDIGGGPNVNWKYSSDAGATWTPVPGGPGGSWYASSANRGGRGCKLGNTWWGPLTGANLPQLYLSKIVDSGGGTFTWSQNLITSFVGTQYASSLAVTTDGTNLLLAGNVTGVGGIIYRSTNGGTSWTQVYLSTAGAIVDIVYAGGKFVALGFLTGGSRLMTSPDGVTWTELTMPPGVTGSPTGLSELLTPGVLATFTDFAGQSSIVVSIN